MNFAITKAKKNENYINSYEQHKPAVFGGVKMVDYAQEFARIFNV
jgi:hypothetical protein